ncbi:ribonuclease D-like isoform X1 [Mytilus californianus]|uniref:ribonuclease D-like isoform X1 n=1 Tax=Mytilus californianus TaxID=6549 RepID=UPI00224600A1|nr:ribonuclease D-like isoform X1 [Mytilus californianus]XP_052081829.1 ribonuclease D-like isoform X1 [Mytilus californianus]
MASNPKVEIITETDKCLPIVEHLAKCDFIALDAEGINLGKDGPLTLLQIGTMDDKVYLFDIETNTDLFRKGKLKDILQSDKPIKVIHSCAGDSAALYHQFDIKLNNVFDTQVAHLVIEENKGRKLPPSMKLSDVCQMYNDKAKPLDQKDELKVKWTKEDGELWARRPLTAEMIEYASNDVTALIPTVYHNQKRTLEENKLLTKYQERVEDEINYYIDETAPQRRRTRVDGIVESIISDIERKYGKDTKFQDITDEDEINALHNVRYDAEVMSPFIKQLKTEMIKAQLKELGDQLSTEGNTFIPKARSYGFLKAYQNIPDKDIQEEAKRLQKALDTIILSDMANKYSLNTKVNVVKKCEKDALQSIRPRHKDDNNFNPILLSLYWQKQEIDLDFEIEQLEITGRSYRITQGKYKWIKFNCSANVPNGIKIKAKRQLVKLDKTFGKGKYSA